ncbi:MAG: serine--tRNA ligase [Bacilli bacterium]
MLDLRLIRTNVDGVKKQIETRGKAFPEFDQLAKLDVERRDLIAQTEQLKSRRNEVSSLIAQMKREKKDADALILEMREVGDKVKELDDQLRIVDENVQSILLSFPNIPHSSVPIGLTEEENVVLRTWGEVPTFDFEPQPHWDVAEGLGLLDFERAAKVTGSRFVYLKGAAAKLERALIGFMLDVHTEEHGYTEMVPPFIVNRSSMTGTGQLPKFEEDAFKLEGTEYFLIPTAEVPVTNYHADEILTNDQLPIKYTAHSACFRAEAGSAGRDTRGLIRQHQFNKVELVQFVTPESSYEALESLTNQAEKILQKLELPYRVLSLCTGDIGFSSAKTYDLEVWLPSFNMYREISSCSNFEDFQARRAGIRFRRDKDSKPEFVHTLNGSGLAIGRTVAAILENYQQADGTVKIPTVLQPYMGGKAVIE